MEKTATARRRLVAFLCDWMIWTYVFAAVVYFFRYQIANSPPVLFGATFDLTALYLVSLGLGFECAGLTGSLAMTPGQKLVGISVRGRQGVELGIGRRLLRFLAWNVGLLLFFAGTLAILVPPHQAWHDRVSGVEVILLSERGPARVVPWYRTFAGMVLALVLVETIVLGWRVTEVDLYRLVTQSGKIGNVTRFLIRPQWSVFGRVVDALIETIFLALMSTVFAVPAAFVLSFLAARNLMLPVHARLDGLLGAVLLALAGLWVGGVLADLLRAMVQSLFVLNLLGLFFQAGGLIAGAWLGARGGRYLIQRLSPGGARIAVAMLGAIAGVLVMRAAVDVAVTVLLSSDWGEFSELFPGPAGGALALGALAFGWAAARRGPENRFPVGRVIYYGVRTILNITRSIEPLIWAIVFVVWVRVGPFPGMLALTVHSVAALAKLYSEQVESIDPGPVEAIQSTGANMLQTIAYAIIPQVVPSYTAFTIYRWDINVRMSTIIGMVGGGGIGQRLQQAMQLSQWRDAGLVILLIVVVVMSLDFVSAKIRERIV